MGNPTQTQGDEDRRCGNRLHNVYLQLYLQLLAIVADMAQL